MEILNIARKNHFTFYQKLISLIKAKITLDEMEVIAEARHDSRRRRSRHFPLLVARKHCCRRHTAAVSSPAVSICHPCFHQPGWITHNMNQPTIVELELRWKHRENVKQTHWRNIDLPYASSSLCNVWYGKAPRGRVDEI